MNANYTNNTNNSKQQIVECSEIYDLAILLHAMNQIIVKDCSLLFAFEGIIHIGFNDQRILNR